MMQMMRVSTKQCCVVELIVTLVGYCREEAVLYLCGYWPEEEHSGSNCQEAHRFRYVMVGFN